MPKPDVGRLELPWRQTERCPCGSARAYGHCCAHPDGGAYVKSASCRPPGAKTGYAHPKCYASSTNDCSTQISREHYISRGVLDKFEELNLSGLPFLPRGETRRLSSNALTATILCERHNNALSPLDDAAIHAFDTIHRAFGHARKLVADNRSRHYLISGEALERWVLKTLLGLYHAKIIAFSSQPTRSTHRLDTPWLVGLLFTDQLLPPPLGLYVHFETETVVEDHIQCAPLAPADGSALVSGLQMNLLGMALDLIVERRGAELTIAGREPLYRPTVIDIDTPLRVSRIVATWPDRVRVRRVGLGTAWRDKPLAELVPNERISAV